MNWIRLSRASLCLEWIKPQDLKERFHLESILYNLLQFMCASHHTLSHSSDVVAASFKATLISIFILIDLQINITSLQLPSALWGSSTGEVMREEMNHCKHLEYKLLLTPEMADIWPISRPFPPQKPIVCFYNSRSREHVKLIVLLHTAKVR